MVFPTPGSATVKVTVPLPPQRVWEVKPVGTPGETHISSAPMSGGLFRVSASKSTL